MIYINTRQELAAFARDHRLRPDWHEPDEQGISALVVGDHLDNAMGSHGNWPTPDMAEWRRFQELADPAYAAMVGKPSEELRVVLTEEEDFADDPSRSRRKPVAVVNLADLLAWATAPR